MLHRIALPLVATLALGGAAFADGEAPLGNVFRDALAAETLQRAAGTTYYEGGRTGQAALVEHTLRVTKQGVESEFSEHYKSGDVLTTIYRLDLTGVVQSVEIRKATKSSYPKPTSTTRAKREGEELVIAGEPVPKRVPMSAGAVPMPVMMFVLPSLVTHLPELLSLSPLNGVQVLPTGFTLQRLKSVGDEVACEIKAPDKTSIMTIFVSLAEGSRGQILRIEARKDQVKPLSAKVAKAQIAKLHAPVLKAPTFATPLEAVEGLIKACAAKDLKAVGACFSAQAPQEFQSLRDGSASPKSFDQLCKLFRGATPGAVKLDGERAEVEVALVSRKERLTVVKEGAGWKVLDF